MVFDRKQYAKEYRENNKEEQKIYNKWYRQTPKGKMSNTIGTWKRNGLIWNNIEEIEGIYGLYLSSERCENCNCLYTEDNVKDMDHNHDNGKFRNILCHSCNMKRKNNNTTGIPNISKHKNGWQYQIIIKGKLHYKSSKDLEWLKQYKLEYEKNNIYIH